MDGTKQKIIEAATKLYAERGFNVTTFDDIAMLSGVSELKVLEHFANKEVIAAAIVEDFRNKLEVALTSLFHMGCDRSKIDFQAEFYKFFYHQYGFLPIKLFSEVYSKENNLVNEIYLYIDEIKQFFYRFLSYIKYSQNHEETVEMLVSKLIGAVNMARVFTNAEIFERTCSSIISSLLEDGDQN